MSQFERDLLETDLTDEEMDELESLLTVMEDETRATMDLATLQGFMTALAIGPGTVLPSQWLPWVWDMEEGEVKPDFETIEDAQQALNQVMRFYNGVVRQFLNDPQGFEPLYLRDDWHVIDWCEGFILATQFDEPVWLDAISAEPDLFTPLITLLDLAEDDEFNEEEFLAELWQWTEALLPATLGIHALFQSRRTKQPGGLVEDEFYYSGTVQQPFLRDGSKVGRNDPCPCGSGKKFKKCCNSPDPTLH